jgi:hypothetical protein
LFFFPGSLRLEIFLRAFPKYMHEDYETIFCFRGEIEKRKSQGKIISFLKIIPSEKCNFNSMLFYFLPPPIPSFLIHRNKPYPFCIYLSFFSFFLTIHLTQAPNLLLFWSLMMLQLLLYLCVYKISFFLPCIEKKYMQERKLAFNGAEE